jgi:rhodanese-related sulfurtransferase
MSSPPSEADARVRRVSASAALTFLNRTDRTVQPVLFDVRDRASFDKGRLARAEHLTEADLPAALARLARATPLVIYCYHGHASQEYARTFCDFGFEEVYSVDGGFEALAELLLEDAPRPPAEASAAAEATDFSGPFLVGDLVYSVGSIHNDGGIPDAEPDALLAHAGSRGVIVRMGRLEADPSLSLYVVRFERDDGTLGPPVGCLPGELTQDAASPPELGPGG